MCYISDVVVNVTCMKCSVIECGHSKCGIHTADTVCTYSICIYGRRQKFGHVWFRKNEYKTL